MLNEIVTKLVEEQEDMETSRVDTDEQSLAEKISVWQPDVLLMSCAADKVSESSVPLLQLRPGLRVIALTGSGRDATLCELRPHETWFESVSSESLIDTIRYFNCH